MQYEFRDPVDPLSETEPSKEAEDFGVKRLTRIIETYKYLSVPSIYAPVKLEHFGQEATNIEDRHIKYRIYYGVRPSEDEADPPENWVQVTHDRPNQPKYELTFFILRSGSDEVLRQSHSEERRWHYEEEYLEITSPDEVDDLCDDLEAALDAERQNKIAYEELQHRQLREYREAHPIRSRIEAALGRIGLR